MRATGSCETPKARDQANIGLGVSYTLGLKSSWQPVCHGTRAHPRDVMKGQPDAPAHLPVLSNRKERRSIPRAGAHNEAFPLAPLAKQLSKTTRGSRTGQRDKPRETRGSAGQTRNERKALHHTAQQIVHEHKKNVSSNGLTPENVLVFDNDWK